MGRYSLRSKTTEESPLVEISVEDITHNLSQPEIQPAINLPESFPEIVSDFVNDFYTCGESNRESTGDTDETTKCKYSFATANEEVKIENRICKKRKMDENLTPGPSSSCSPISPSYSPIR